MTKQKKTLSLTEFACQRLVIVANATGLNQSEVVETLIRQTELGEHIGAHVDVPLVDDGENLCMYKIGITNNPK